MKSILRFFSTDYFIGLLLSVFTIFGYMLPLTYALALPVSWESLLFYSAVVGVFFSFPAAARRNFLLLFFCVWLGVIGFSYLRFFSLSQCVYAFTSLSGQAQLDVLAVHAHTFIPLCCCVCAFLFTFSYYERSALSPFAFISVPLYVIILLCIKPDFNALYILPLLAVVLLALGRSSQLSPGLSRVLPSAALCLLAALLLVPSAVQPSAPLAGFMQKTRQFIEDHFLFTQSRTVYSIYSSGYQPYGHDRLGGPISPSDEAVMEVETSETALLRGVVLNTYTGSGWHNTLPANRYLLGDLRFQGLRRKTFDLQLPAASLREGNALFEPRTLNVHMLKDAFSTLYVPGRTQTLAPGEGLVPYFSPAGEVFITRDLALDDRYSVSAPLFHAGTPGVAQLVEQARQQSDAAYADIAEDYTDVPDLVENAVYQLAHAVTQNANTPFEKAQKLCDFLSTRYPYTYAQNVPPTDRDFVSWFLLEEKQGYCVSFASSMAVMGRIVGLPTRYVEGYVAHPAADGIARVSEKDAHAWAEVYFSGFGWVSFDPTPGSTLPDDSSQDTQDPPPSDADTPPEPTPTPTPEASTPPDDSGENTQPTPSPSPSPDPDDNPPPSADAPTPTPPPAAAQHTPTPPPSQPQGDPHSPDASDDDSAPPLWWLLLLLLLIAAVAARLYTAQPAFVAARVRHPRMQIPVYYRAILTLLSCMRLERRIGESPLSHAVRVWHTLDGKNARDLTGIVRAAQIVSAAQYGLHVQIDPADIDFLSTVYLRLFKRMTPLQKLHLYALRLIHGVGNYKSI